MVKNVNEINTYLTEQLETFDKDPPDTEFQAGYKAALLEVLKYILSAE